MSVREIKSLLAQADRLDGEADQARWEAARQIVEQLDKGMTTRDLAEKIGRSQSFVSQYSRVWREYHDTHGNQTFGALVRLVQGVKDPGERQEIIRHASSTNRSVATVQDHRSRQRSRARDHARHAEEARRQAKRDTADSPPLDIPAPTRQWSMTRQLAAEGFLMKAIREMSAFIRLSYEYGPVVGEDRAKLEDHLLQLKERVAWAESALSSTLDWDEALRTLSEEG